MCAWLPIKGVFTNSVNLDKMPQTAISDQSTVVGMGPRSLVDKTLNPLGFSPLWFEPCSGHMWESQVLLTDGQVVFLRVLRFSPTFDERSARYK